nr:MAG TPA: hypothetical protein [Caudoviricetes sp.]
MQKKSLKLKFMKTLGLEIKVLLESAISKFLL